MISTDVFYFASLPTSFSCFPQLSATGSMNIFDILTAFFYFIMNFNNCFKGAKLFCSILIKCPQNKSSKATIDSGLQFLSEVHSFLLQVKTLFWGGEETKAKQHLYIKRIKSLITNQREETLEGVISEE